MTHEFPVMCCMYTAVAGPDQHVWWVRAELGLDSPESATALRQVHTDAHLCSYGTHDTRQQVCGLTDTQGAVALGGGVRGGWGEATLFNIFLSCDLLYGRHNVFK